VAPGTRGVLNTMAPTHFRIDDLHTLEHKPPITWIRGEADQIVSDTSVYDLAYLGSVGAVPGWPGADVAPPQPMIAQTRAVLDRYARSGGAVTEVVIEDAGHSPHVERPAEFVAALVSGWKSASPPR
jgi:pimeloyl-ACP methyl ester carboxylesterase